MNQMIQSPLSSSHGSPRIAIIASTWHADIVERGCTALRDELQRLGVPPDAVSHHEVPGAFEIPLLAQRLARRGDVDAVVACGFVVDGGIYRHEFVAAAVIDGLMRVQLDTGVPVLSCVLTPQAFHEHDVHQRFFAEHMVDKGVEVARACVRTVALARELDAAAN